MNYRRLYAKRKKKRRKFAFTPSLAGLHEGQEQIE